MIDPIDIPASPVERAAMLEGILVSRATGGLPDERLYQQLRAEFVADDSIRALLPHFVRTYRQLNAFWSFIKHEADTYAKRSQIINDAFTPLMDHLERRNTTPGDDLVSEALRTFDVDGVHAVWEKAITRRHADPEGAITIARTLLEAVSKRILDEANAVYSDRDDLPALYAKASGVLRLAPNQHTEAPIKAILGGAMNLVNGIGTLRNRLSDAHAPMGKRPVRPSSRHAALAVNTAGAIATFLVETSLERLKEEGSSSADQK